MQRLLTTLVMLTWSLWFGGLIVLFIAVQSLFKTFADDRTIAGAAAAGIFRRFNRYQLALAGIALVGSFAWSICCRKAAFTALFSCFALAALAAVVVGGVITPRIEAMRLEHVTHTAEFAKLHGLSMLTYSIEAACLLIAGCLLPSEVRRGK